MIVKCKKQKPIRRVELQKFVIDVKKIYWLILQG